MTESLKEREAFENWARSKWPGCDLSTDIHGNYRGEGSCLMFLGWQARAALSQEEETPLTTDLDEGCKCEFNAHPGLEICPEFNPEGNLQGPFFCGTKFSPNNYCGHRKECHKC